MPEDSFQKDYLARYATYNPDGSITCTLCPRGCVIKEGKRGFCFVRKNVNGKIVLTAYGQSSGFAIDPIEKKPLYHFLPGSKTLSFGTAGCNLACEFCQNWNLSRAETTQRMSERASPEMIAQAARKFDCRSVAFTYNDPVIFLEYAVDAAKECHAAGIGTVAVTAGYINSAAREEFFEHIDAVNVDLKSIREEFYKKMTKGHLQPVLDTLIYIKKKKKTWLEITNLLIPEKNDSEKEIIQMCQWIIDQLGKDIPLHFSAFHPDYKLLDASATTVETLRNAREIALSKGIRYVYCGNISMEEGSDTHCHKCREVLISRDWFDVTQCHLKQGKCPKCQTPLPGIF